jgi:uncharacterized protein (TIGR02996 family)
MLTISDLWRQVAEFPEDLGPRAVLADALLERGDPRGELITLQCAEITYVTRPRIQQLIEQHWETWLGELTAILDPDVTRFERGVLHRLGIGMRTTPASAYAQPFSNRELATVDDVRPTYVGPAHYASVIAALPRIPHELGVHTPDLLPHLVAQRATWPMIERLHYAHRASFTWQRRPPSLLDLMLDLARVFPAISELHLYPRGLPHLGELPDVTARIPSLFLRLHKIVLHDLRWLRGHFGHEDRLGKLPLVELVY